MTATVHLLISTTTFFQNRSDLLYMHVFPIVAGAHERQFLRCEAKLFGATTLHEWQSL